MKILTAVIRRFKPYFGLQGQVSTTEVRTFLTRFSFDTFAEAEGWFDPHRGERTTTGTLIYRQSTHENYLDFLELFETEAQ